MMDLVEMHDRALERMGDQVAAIEASQWKDPTPCTEWDVRDLVHHNVYENLWAGALGSGATIDEVGDRFDGDLLGDDALTAYETSARAAAEAFRQPAALEQPVAVSYGPISGEEYLRHRVFDLVVHGWDVAKATGQDTAIDPALLEAVARIADEEAEMIRTSGLFASGVVTPPDADTQTRLLALTGRRP